MKEEILQYYNNSAVESYRLDRDSSQLEKIRTQLIIEEFLNKAPLKILDVGGGAGVYSFWLKEKGHEVHLLDPSSVNLEHERKKAEEKGCQLDAIVEGVAENLPYQDESFDVVLFLGPLYHLTERDERIKAIKEAKRVLKKGGVVFAAAISRYASLFDGFMRNLVADPAFVSILQEDLKNGQHRNQTDNFQYFTTAYFHHPKELKEELSVAGFDGIRILPVESFGWLLPDFAEKWKDKKFRELLLKTIKTVEEDEILLGVSSHLVGVGVK